MGCAQSRIENEEAVARCKERRQWMKTAVAARNAFAAAHSAYAFSLRDTGAALSEFAHGEGVPPPAEEEEAGEAAAQAGAAAPGGAGAAKAAPGVAGTSAAGEEPIMPPPPPSSIDPLPPPPPPLPEFSPSPAKIHRSISMPLPPTTAAKGPSVLHSDSIREEDEEEEEGEDDGQLDDRRRRLRHQPPVQLPVSPPPPETPVTPQPPPPPPPESKSGVGTWDYFFSMDEGMASIGPDDDEIMPEPEEERYVTPSPPRRFPSPPQAAPIPLSPPRPAPIPLSEEFEELPQTPEMVTPPPSSLSPKPPKNSSKKKKGKGKMKAAHHLHTESAPPITLGGGGKVARDEKPRVDLLKVLAEIDERFLKASESAGEVSKMLEANRMHYHSNFVDNRVAELDEKSRGGRSSIGGEQ